MSSRNDADTDGFPIMHKLVFWYVFIKCVWKQQPLLEYIAIKCRWNIKSTPLTSIVEVHSPIQVIAA